MGKRIQQKKLGGGERNQPLVRIYPPGGVVTFDKKSKHEEFRERGKEVKKSENILVSLFNKSPYDHQKKSAKKREEFHIIFNGGGGKIFQGRRNIYPCQQDHQAESPREMSRYPG